MLYTTQLHSNITVELQFQGLLERLIISTLTTVLCCVFLFINVTMLFTLRSKPVFLETSRYVLLYNLLFADTAQLVQSQVLYLLAAYRIKLTYPLCGTLSLFANLVTVVSPLTLVVMSLERYVAVCYPLRHAAIITVRNTAVAILLVWTFSSLSVLIRVFLLLRFPFDDLESLQMTDFCSAVAMLLGPLADDYDKAYTCILFVSAGVAIISSYIGVMVAARLASADKSSASKARNTLLLHLVQLGLSLSSTIFNPLLAVLSRVIPRLLLVRIVNVFYVCIVISPRCLTSLIYGLRDQTIRPVLMSHLCCRHS
ncbi:odorant receptor 131-2-like [Echeneis naucrates]|nr:odorant receptor 131-2-like [Echeneis naucrates]